MFIDISSHRRGEYLECSVPAGDAPEAFEVEVDKYSIDRGTEEQWEMVQKRSQVYHWSARIRLNGGAGLKAYLVFSCTLQQ